MEFLKRTTRIGAVLRAMIFLAVGYLAWIFVIATLSILADAAQSPDSICDFIHKSFFSQSHTNESGSLVSPETKMHRFFLLFLFATALAALGSIALPGFLDPGKDQSASVVLVDTTDSKVKRLIDALFGKHSIFKNAYRGWLPSQALFITCNVILSLATGTLVLMFSMNVFAGTSMTVFALSKVLFVTPTVASSVPLAFASLWYLVYQRIHAEFSSKWSHCSAIFHKCIERANTNEKFDQSRIALALDLLHMDLWAKRSFALEFSSVLRYALSLKASPDEYLKELDERRMSEETAQRLLEGSLRP